MKSIDHFCVFRMLTIANGKRLIFVKYFEMISEGMRLSYGVEGSETPRLT